jgi:uncharacterized protein YfbU (UPF0304 family)
VVAFILLKNGIRCIILVKYKGGLDIMELSKKDRLILYNQYEILKFLNSNDKHMTEQYELNQEILWNGFKHNYSDLVENMDNDIPDHVSEFVWDVLRMYRTLNNSYLKLSEEEKKEINVSDIRYQGFDGNEEGKHYSYANFILEKMKHYEEIYDNGHVELNSHANRVLLYQTMLEEWSNITDNKYQILTLKQIRKIIE